MRFVGEAARSEVFVADQGQAGVVGGAAGSRGHRRRTSRTMVRRAPERGQAHRGQGDRSRVRPGSGSPGARSDAAQGGARHFVPSGKACRLPGTGSLEIRAFHRGGRFRRRFRKAGATARQPGGAPAARQDSQCRAGAFRQGAVLRRARDPDHGAGDRHRRGLRRREGALPQDHHHDGRGCRRQPHPNASAYLFLPPDAANHRAGLSPYSAAAAIPGEERRQRTLPQGRSGDGSVSHRGRAARRGSQSPQRIADRRSGSSRPGKAGAVRQAPPATHLQPAE